jgi:hypothetical protein
MYKDGTAEVSGSFIGQNDSLPTTQALIVGWTGLATDFNKVVKTYQAPVITEFATLGLACGMVAGLAGLEITEVTLRGDRADYWLGDKDLMLEVSGQESGDLAALCDEKSEQLANNPYGKDGYLFRNRLICDLIALSSMSSPFARPLPAENLFCFGARLVSVAGTILAAFHNTANWGKQLVPKICLRYATSRVTTLCPTELHGSDPMHIELGRAEHTFGGRDLKAAVSTVARGHRERRRTGPCGDAAAASGAL